MSRAVILHGTDANPDANWFQWLKHQLENKEFEVWVPELPNNHTPNRHIYNEFFLNSGWNFEDNIIIGHSSGAVSVLNILNDTRFPKVKAAIMVGAWAHMDDTELDGNQFKNLFPGNGFNFETIKQKADKLLFIHGDNDPYCPLDQAEWLAQQTGAEITIIPNGHHLGSARSPEFPELWNLLNTQNIV